MSIRSLSDAGPHKVGYALCDCGFKAVVACPLATDDQALECDACGSVRLQFVDRAAFRRGVAKVIPITGART